MMMKGRLEPIVILYEILVGAQILTNSHCLLHWKHSTFWTYNPSD